MSDKVLDRNTYLRVRHRIRNKFRKGDSVKFCFENMVGKITSKDKNAYQVDFADHVVWIDSSLLIKTREAING